eukprot:TRINITY_DN32296_c0_g1_i1.p1 TRINITY_DN32296_c0_g1~~TRINITY_DN32296_c0_g1_i1.p1  ORF type:complete len:542 (-),score=95.26 TRINITY_DN32296_c0_g1_i1:210-1775(-)
MAGAASQRSQPVTQEHQTSSQESVSGVNLGVARDTIAVGEHGVDIGFGIAKWATNLGFSIASGCIKAPAEALEGAAGPNVFSSGLHGLGSVVQFAHGVTRAGQEAAHGITKVSLGAAKVGLTAAGAKDGQLLRLAVGDEAAETVLAIEDMVKRYVEPLSRASSEGLLAAASAWSATQRALPAPRRPQVALPEHTERWMRFAGATFGASWLAGLVEGFSMSAAARAREAWERGGEAVAALAMAGVEGHVEVVEFEQGSSHLFQPGYLVAVDHQTGHVVVALRGTSSVRDALADLACKPAHIELAGQSGEAHEGMLTAARKLKEKLAATAWRGIEMLGSSRAPRLVVVGHSLGAGVGALLTALWRDEGSFPGIDVRCVALACPQVLDKELSVAVSNFTTSVILGDDLVPRFSLATSYDLRAVTLHIYDPEAHGLSQPEVFRSEQLLSAAALGQTEQLVQAHKTLQQTACTATGRLFPAGRLIHLVASGAELAEPDDFDELLISSDMAAAHMPQRYLKAIKEIS